VELHTVLHWLAPCSSSANIWDLFLIGPKQSFQTALRSHRCNAVCSVAKQRQRLFSRYDFSTAYLPHASSLISQLTCVVGQCFRKPISCTSAAPLSSTWWRRWRATEETSANINTIRTLFVLSTGMFVQHHIRTDSSITEFYCLIYACSTRWHPAAFMIENSSGTLRANVCLCVTDVPWVRLLFVLSLYRFHFFGVPIAIYLVAFKIRRLKSFVLCWPHFIAVTQGFPNLLWPCTPSAFRQMSMYH